MNRTILPPGTLNQLQNAFDHAAENDTAGVGFTRALAGERAQGLAIFDLPPDKLAETLQEYEGAAKQNGESAGIPKKELKKLNVQRQYLEESYNRVLVARKEPFPARLKAGEIFTARVAEAKTKVFYLCALLMPALAKSSGSEAKNLARLRLAQTAVALERFRAAHENRYPTTLAELSPSLLPEVPTDPFDGQPLRYRKKGNGYQLYSISADLKDDSGKAETSGGAGDLEFTVVKPPVVAAEATPPVTP